MASQIYHIFLALIWDPLHPLHLQLEIQGWIFFLRVQNNTYFPDCVAQFVNGGECLWFYGNCPNLSSGLPTSSSSPKCKLAFPGICPEISGGRPCHVKHVCTGVGRWAPLPGPGAGWEMLWSSVSRSWSSRYICREFNLHQPQSVDASTFSRVCGCCK